MVTIPELIKILKLENRLVHDQTRDLTHADTLIQPKPSGNCMNWVLGHLLDTLIEIRSLNASSLSSIYNF